MKILVCGSRSFNNYPLLEEALTMACLTAVKSGTNPMIMHGGAKGADALADRFAIENGVDRRVYAADWDTYGKRAGILRNLEMLDQNPDVVFAFAEKDVNGLPTTPGTRHTVVEARRRNFRVAIIPPNTRHRGLR